MDRVFRFMHAADLHLDSPFRGLRTLPEPLRARVADSTFDALQRMTSLAVQEEVDAVLIAGDLYDLEDRSLRAQLAVQRASMHLAEHGIQVFIVHGNHDPLDGWQAKLSWPEQVVFFGSEAVQEAPVVGSSGELLALVQGISYGTSAVVDNLSLGYQRRRQDVFTAGLLHCNVGGDSAHGNYAGCSAGDLLKGGMDYWALGHIHTRKVIHDSPAIVYAGNTQGRSIKETGSKGVYIGTAEGRRLRSLTFHETQAVRWELLELRIDELSGEQQLKEKLERDIAELSWQCGRTPLMLRVALTGRGPLHERLRRTSAAEELAADWNDGQLSALRLDPGDSFVWIAAMSVETMPAIDLELAAGGDSFLGELLRGAEQLRGNPRELEQVLQEVMSPLLQSGRLYQYVGLDEESDRLELLEAAKQMAVDLLLEADEE